MMKKGDLEKLIDREFGGSWVSAANEMVVMFCEKYGIPGSVGSYNLYEKIQNAWEEILDEEKEYWEDQAKLWKN